MTTTATMENVKPVYSTEPRDLPALRPWFNVIRCLRRAARPVDGPYSVIKIVIVTDNNNDHKPINWTSPKVTAIEPRTGTQTLDLLLSILGE